MTPRIFDLTGAERDMDWLQAKYGNIQYLDAGNVPKFALTSIHEQTGWAVIRVLVLNAADGPQYAQPVINHWPDDNLQLLTGGGLVTLYHDRGLFLRTSLNGIVDFGFGGGSMIRDLATGGPHTLWIGSPSLPSDGIANVGWLGGTDHTGPLSFVFQVVDGDDPPPPPPKQGWRCKLAGWLRAWAEKLCPGEDVGAWMWDVSDEALRIEMANWGD